MSKPRFGQILDPDLKPTRDAVHVPIIPVYAGIDLMCGGESIRIYPIDGGYEAVPDDTGKAIVDPFLDKLLEAGDLFYAWLRPESAQKLWHEWTCPVIDGKKKGNQ